MKAPSDIYTLKELNSGLSGIQYLLQKCEAGDIDQHLSPALMIAFDCIRHQIDNGNNSPDCEHENYSVGQICLDCFELVD